VDLLPEENTGISLVPQLLCNRAEDFIWAASSLRDRGYTEINLNLGCPSGTVVSKHKGAGFLGLPYELDSFLNDIFCAQELSGLKISVKTRLGLTREDEFPELLEIYRQYPIYMLIVHPRLRTDYYKGAIRPDSFVLAKNDSPFPVIWNGDIFTPADLAALKIRFPDTDTVMIGRGLIAEPGLHVRIETDSEDSREHFQAFHNALCEEYRQILFGDTALCHRMKEYWGYWIHHFEGGEKYLKRLCKSKSLSEYSLAAQAIFAELPMRCDTHWETGLSEP